MNKITIIKRLLNVEVVQYPHMAKIHGTPIRFNRFWWNFNFINLISVSRLVCNITERVIIPAFEQNRRFNVRFKGHYCYSFVDGVGI